MRGVLANSTRRVLKEGVHPTLPASIGTSAKTSTFLDQALQRCQSLEIIRASVGFSIGCLAYLRDLIPEDSFSRATYGHPSSDIYSYSGLVETRENAIGAPDNSDSAQCNHKATGSGTRVSILKRGHSEEVDQLLDWIEFGVFDALEKNVLAAVQFAIFLDKEKPEDIAESYTFSFKYECDLRRGTRRLSGMDVAGPSGQSITLRSARDKLQGFLRSLCAIMSLLPPLPAERYLNIRLYYTDDCPPEYEPPGFKKCESNPMYFSESENLKVAKEGIEMKTGIHMHVYLPPKAYWAPVSAIDTLSRRKGDTCTSKVMADDDIEITTSNSSVQCGSLQDEIAGQSRSQVGEDTLPLGTSDHTNGAEKPDTVMADISDTQNTEQVGIDVAQKIELMKMLSSQSQSSNIETLEQGSSSQVTQQCQQLCIRTPSPIRQNQEPSDRRGGVYDVDAEARENTGSIDSVYQKVTLSKRKLTQLLWDKKSKSSSLQQVTESPLAHLNEKDIVSIRCECGTTKREVAMLSCDFCGHSQHVHCYGYCNSQDPRIPNPHTCYSCLLSGAETQILEDLRQDCIFRRALKLIHEDGYPTSEKKFSELLGCSLQGARLITSRLRKEGFIDAMNHKKRSTQKGVPKFKVLTDIAKVDAMKLRYFDPLARIAHHYDVPRPVGGLLPSMEGSINFPQPIESSHPSSSTLRGKVDSGSSPPKSARRDFEATEDEDTTDELIPLSRIGVTHKTMSSKSTNSASRRKSPRLEKQNKKYIDLQAEAAVFRDSLNKEKPTAMKRKQAESNIGTSKRPKMSENNRLFSVSEQCDEERRKA